MGAKLCIFSLILLVSLALGVRAEVKPGAKRDKAAIEQAVRLQVYLDRANFGPGKIDGRYGDFTRKALVLYRQAHGGALEQPPAIAEGTSSAGVKGEKAKSRAIRDQAPPDVSDLDLSAIDPVFTEYTVSEQDARVVGEVPHGPAAQAKLKSLPYRSVAEAVAEKFHCDVDFLAELNSGKKNPKPGDVVTVPNVEPFELAEVKTLKTGKGVNEEGDEESTRLPKSKREKSAEASKDDKKPSGEIAIHIGTKLNMLEVRAGDQLKAAFPVTVGSQQLSSPIGEWKVQRLTKMPTFRYDPQMLKHGVRSSNYHLLPPGPNNPVGILWIALNKKGIGIHGTDSPDTIGRSASHGCIRLSNWDVAKLATMVSPGTRVTID